jgi:hypothetical protein
MLLARKTTNDAISDMAGVKELEACVDYQSTRPFRYKGFGSLDGNGVVDTDASSLGKADIL